MGYEVNVIFATDIFQENGSTTWTWNVGDAGTYMGFSVAPAQANCERCEVTEVFYSTINAIGNAMVVHITVNLNYPNIGDVIVSGGPLTFFAIGAPSI